MAQQPLSFLYDRDNVLTRNNYEWAAFKYLHNKDAFNKYIDYCDDFANPEFDPEFLDGEVVQSQLLYRPPTTEIIVPAIEKYIKPLRLPKFDNLWQRAEPLDPLEYAELQREIRKSSAPYDELRFMLELVRRMTGIDIREHLVHGISVNVRGKDDPVGMFIYIGCPLVDSTSLPFRRPSIQKCEEWMRERFSITALYIAYFSNPSALSQYEAFITNSPLLIEATNNNGISWLASDDIQSIVDTYGPPPEDLSESVFIRPYMMLLSRLTGEDAWEFMMDHGAISSIMDPKILTLRSVHARFNMEDYQVVGKRYPTNEDFIESGWLKYVGKSALPKYIDEPLKVPRFLSTRKQVETDYVVNGTKSLLAAGGVKLENDWPVATPFRDENDKTLIFSTSPYFLSGSFNNRIIPYIIRGKSAMDYMPYYMTSRIRSGFVWLLLNNRYRELNGQGRELHEKIDTATNWVELLSGNFGETVGVTPDDVYDWPPNRQISTGFRIRLGWILRREEPDLWESIVNQMADGGVTQKYYFPFEMMLDEEMWEKYNPGPKPYPTDERTLYHQNTPYGIYTDYGGPADAQEDAIPLDPEYLVEPPSGFRKISIFDRLSKEWRVAPSTVKLAIERGYKFTENEKRVFQLKNSSEEQKRVLQNIYESGDFDAISQSYIHPLEPYVLVLNSYESQNELRNELEYLNVPLIYLDDFIFNKLRDLINTAYYIKWLKSNNFVLKAPDFRTLDIILKLDMMGVPSNLYRSLVDHAASREEIPTKINNSALELNSELIALAVGKRLKMVIPLNVRNQNLSTYVLQSMFTYTNVDVNRSLTREEIQSELNRGVPLSSFSDKELLSLLLTPHYTERRELIDRIAKPSGFVIVNSNSVCNNASDIMATDFSEPTPDEMVIGYIDPRDDNYVTCLTLPVLYSPALNPEYTPIPTQLFFDIVPAQGRSSRVYYSAEEAKNLLGLLYSRYPYANANDFNTIANIYVSLRKILSNPDPLAAAHNKYNTLPARDQRTIVAALSDIFYMGMRMRKWPGPRPDGTIPPYPYTEEDVTRYRLEWEAEHPDPDSTYQSCLEMNVSNAIVQLLNALLVDGFNGINIQGTNISGDFIFNLRAYNTVGQLTGKMIKQYIQDMLSDSCVSVISGILISTSYIYLKEFIGEEWIRDNLGFERERLPFVTGEGVQ